MLSSVVVVVVVVVFVCVGKCWQDKVEDVRKELKEKSASFLVVTALDEVACEWLDG